MFSYEKPLIGRLFLKYKNQKNTDMKLLFIPSIMNEDWSHFNALLTALNSKKQEEKL
jgi:hypothetical protein